LIANRRQKSKDIDSEFARQIQKNKIIFQHKQIEYEQKQQRQREIINKKNDKKIIKTKSKADNRNKKFARKIIENDRKLLIAEAKERKTIEYRDYKDAKITKKAIEKERIANKSRLQKASDDQITKKDNETKQAANIKKLVNAADKKKTDKFEYESLFQEYNEYRETDSVQRSKHGKRNQFKLLDGFIENTKVFTYFTPSMIASIRTKPTIIRDLHDDMQYVLKRFMNEFINEAPKQFSKFIIARTTNKNAPILPMKYHSEFTEALKVITSDGTVSGIIKNSNELKKITKQPLWKTLNIITKHILHKIHGMPNVRISSVNRSNRHQTNSALSKTDHKRVERFSKENQRKRLRMNSLIYNKPKNNKKQHKNNKEQPKNNKEQPKNNKEQPKNNMEQPKNNKEQPKNNKEQPKNNTEQPKNNTEQPKNNKEQPKNNTEQPKNNTEQPKNNTEQPKNNKEQPKNNKEQPKNNKEQPKNNKEQPKNNTEQPKNNKEQPKNNTEQPKNKTKQPKNNTEQPKNNTEQPKNNTEQPKNNNSFKPLIVPDGVNRMLLSSKLIKFLNSNEKVLHSIPIPSKMKLLKIT